MAWEDILLGEVDVNSPITSSLMTRIKNNLDWLKSALAGWCVANCWEEIESLDIPKETWTTIREIKVYIPSWASKLHFEIRARTGGGNARFRLRDSGSGALSNETADVGDSYAWVSADWNNPPNGWRSIQIQTYTTIGPIGNYVDVYIAELVIIVSEVS